jgi:hypothetical protein
VIYKFLKIVKYLLVDECGFFLCFGEAVLR